MVDVRTVCEARMLAANRGIGRHRRQERTEISIISCRYRAAVHVCVWQKNAMQPCTFSVPSAFLANSER